MLWGLIAMTIAAPCWWFSHGIPAAAAEAALPAWTTAVLLVWSVSGIRDLAKKEEFLRQGRSS
jgi:hypothetical protein